MTLTLPCRKKRKQKLREKRKKK